MNEMYIAIFVERVLQGDLAISELPIPYQEPVRIEYEKRLLELAAQEAEKETEELEIPEEENTKNIEENEGEQEYE